MSDQTQEESSTSGHLNSTYPSLAHDGLNEVRDLTHLSRFRPAYELSPLIKPYEKLERTYKCNRSGAPDCFSPASGSITRFVGDEDPSNHAQVVGSGRRRAEGSPKGAPHSFSRIIEEKILRQTRESSSSK